MKPYWFTGASASGHAVNPAFLACCASWLLATGAAAIEPPKGLTTAAWKLEVVELRDGRRLEGVVVSPAPSAGDEDDEIRFRQVVRRPGRPMYVITWPPLAADRIRSIERLPPEEHGGLVSRVQAFLDGRQRRHDAETSVKLGRDDENGPWRYVGADFELESTADPTITRGAVVALEQVLEGLAILVPPPSTERPRIEVRLCGSAAEYRDVQRSLGIAIDNPAFYIPARRLLVAGGDLPALVEQKRTADDQLATTAQRYDELDREMQVRLKGLATDLERQGMPATKRSETVQRARQRWERELAAARDRIAAARRENEARLERSRLAFRGRLAHEAWHAYADARLRARGAAPLPIWLDEGLAQVVESAPLEAGELRLDAPDPRRLALLQDALRSRRVPSLSNLLREGQAPFLAGHAALNDTGIAYLAAWGLALDVAMLRPVLSAATIATLAPDDDGDPVADFEALVGSPVDRFEAEWAGRILALKPGQSAPGRGTPAP